MFLLECIEADCGDGGMNQEKDNNDSWNDSANLHFTNFFIIHNLLLFWWQIGILFLCL